MELATQANEGWGQETKEKLNAACLGPAARNLNVSFEQANASPMLLGKSRTTVSWASCCSGSWQVASITELTGHGVRIGPLRLGLNGREWLQATEARPRMRKPLNCTVHLKMYLGKKNKRKRERKGGRKGWKERKRERGVIK